MSNCSGSEHLRCTLGTLRPHHSVHLAFTVRAGHHGRFVDHSRVSGQVKDPKPGNNRASAGVIAAAPPCRQNLTFATGFMPGARIGTVRVLVDGRLAQTLHGRNLRRVTIKPLPRTGLHSVTVQFVIGAFETVTATRSFTGCSSGPTHYAYPPQTNPGAS